MSNITNISDKQRAKYQIECIEDADNIAGLLFGDCECCGDPLHEDITLHHLMVQIKAELKRRGYVARPLDPAVKQHFAGGSN